MRVRKKLVVKWYEADPGQQSQELWETMTKEEKLAAIAMCRLTGEWLSEESLKKLHDRVMKGKA